METNSPLNIPFTLDEADQARQGICVLPTQMDRRTWMREYIRRQMEWSHRTFGDGARTIGLSKHIQKELLEIAEHPNDIEEWVDVIILALDGAWRCGRQHDFSPEDIMDMLEYKQQKNFDRQWPAPGGQDQAVEHIREDA